MREEREKTAFVQESDHYFMKMDDLSTFCFLERILYRVLRQCSLSLPPNVTKRSELPK